jgi:hypothetical protein
MTSAALKRRLSTGTLSLGLAAVLVVLGAEVAVAAQAPEAVTAPSQPDAGSTSGAPSAPPADTPAAAPPAPADTAALGSAPQPQPPLTGAPASMNPAVTKAAQTDALDAEAAAEAAAIQQEGTSGGAGPGGAEANRMSIYGFSDFTYTKAFSVFSLNPDASFAVGNLNIYVGTELVRNWRSLVEVRFMYLPDGSQPLGSSVPRTDTTASDYTNEYRAIKWGAINIERAWLERTFNKQLTIRFGQFLTPYGIWNVDHGSPVFIGVAKPYVVGQQFLPESQTGIEVYGTFNVQSTQIGYHLTLSNGRGPIDTYQDLDSNKAVGGRVFAKNDSPFGELSLGGSFYTGRFTDKTGASMFDSNGNLRTVYTTVSQYDELSLAADLKWTLAGLLVQGEIAMNDVAYVSGGRPTYLSFTGGPAGFVSDYRRWGGYALAGYRLPFAGIMPFVEFDYYKEGPEIPVRSAKDLELGVNVRVTPSVVFKAQYTRAQVYFPMSSGQLLSMMRLQLSWSF